MMRSPENDRQTETEREERGMASASIHIKRNDGGETKGKGRSFFIK